MLACYEKFFGKYPFWDDGYALVETPYLGMEHQGAIAYGNQYMSGYLGRMLPRGIDFDYIIIHETGHEYWGNSVSCADHAEMWIHESFCTYSEALYVECMYSFDDAVRYLAMQKSFIDNRKPILGPMNVNFDAWGHSDHYYKGAWVLHTLRNLINDDEKWFGLIKSFHQKHKISVITSDRIKQKGEGVEVSVALKSDVKGFRMPILMGNPDNYRSVKVSSSKSNYYFPDMKVEDFKVADELFLINVKELD